VRTQKAIVLSFLERNPNGVCVASFPPEIAYTLRNRVSELRAQGVAIESERCRAHQHKASVSRYRLAAKGQLGMAL
jgi:hypothetical protein